MWIFFKDAVNAQISIEFLKNMFYGDACSLNYRFSNHYVGV